MTANFLMIHRGAAVVAISTLLAAGPLTGPAASAAATVLDATVDIPCAASIAEQNAHWYIPDGDPIGTVWIQHGFARTDANVAALAESFADAGYLVFAPSLPFMNLSGCTLQNIGDNTAFLRNVASLFGTASDPAGPLATSLATAARRAGKPVPALPKQLVFIGHSAGGEAVAYVADRLRIDYPGVWSDLRGVVLLDPVRSFLGDNTDRALADLDPTGLPILTVSSPASLCNAFGSGIRSVRTLLHRPFLGVELPTGVHTDAEGASSDLLGELACGTPSPANAATLRTLALDWSHDYFTGDISPGAYPATPGAPPADAPTAHVLTGA